jgi:U3 small nucleolar RNA-associated protein 3
MADPQSLLRSLEKNSPETLALAREWEDIAYNLMAAQVKLAK